MTEELLRDFTNFAIARKPTLHDVIHYVAWLGYIDETKNYSATCKEAMTHVEFWYAHSRATYGRSMSTRLHAVCANAWSSKYTRQETEWARTVKDHERWSWVTEKGLKMLSVRKVKFDIAWRATRVQQLLDLSTTWARNNGPVVINTENKHGWTALHAAAYSGNVELVRLLLDAGAYPEGGLPTLVDGSTGAFPAHRCANIMAMVPSKKTPLHAAIDGVQWKSAGLGHSDCIRLLIERGHRMNLCYSDDSPIQYAVKKNRLDCVRALVESGAETDGCLERVCSYKEGERECINIITYLCDNGADVNSIINTKSRPRTDGYTALMYAAETNYAYVVKHLIKCGAILNMRDAFGQTALYIAASLDKYDNVKALLDAGASTKIACDEGLIPLDVANTSEIKCVIARADLARRFTKRKS